MRRIISFLIMIILCITCTTASAERKKVVKDQYYIGAMRVVNCRDYVSLRTEPSSQSERILKVPLGALVLAYTELGEKDGFYLCLTQGEYGYIMTQYLRPIE